MEKEIIYLSEDMQSIIQNHIPNNQILQELSYFYSIFSDSTRLKIIISLLISEMCVNDISKILNINQTTVSHQLKFLKNIGAVTCTKNAKFNFYKVTDKFINTIMINGVDFILNRKIV
jgi:DNA-binding transcriptional ArsR family regulator